MTPTELTTRVTLWSGAGLVAVAVPTLWLGGSRAALGLIAGGALAVLSFRWLAGRAAALIPGAPPSPWVLLATLRWAGIAAAVSVLLATGVVHPAALLAGTVVLPCAVVALGLMAVPKEP